MTTKYGKTTVVGFFAWDFPNAVIRELLDYGFARDILYCPSNSRRNNDVTWGFNHNYSVIGYAFATEGAPLIATTNIFEKALQKVVSMDNGHSYTIGPSEGVFVADLTMSNGVNTENRDKNNYTKNVGFFASPRFPGWPGARSSHIKGKTAAGGHGLYVDGHVTWKSRDQQDLRTTGGIAALWW